MDTADITSNVKNNKMSKKIKFALIMDDIQVRTLRELRECFSLGDIVDDFVDLRDDKQESKLCEWLQDRHHKSEAEEIAKIQKEWKEADNLSLEERQNIIWRIQNVFLPDTLPQRERKKKVSLEEIKGKYDIPCKREFDEKYERALAEIDSENYPVDAWRKYLSRLAWNNAVLQNLIEKEKKKRIYLLGGNLQRSEHDYYLLPLDDEKIGTQYIALRGEDGRKPAVLMVCNNRILTESEWEKKYRNSEKRWGIDFNSVDVYVKNEASDEEFPYRLWSAEKFKGVGVSQSMYRTDRFEENSESAAKENLSRYMDAQFPLIYFKTYEEDKADEIISMAAGGKRVLEWSVEGFFDKSGRKRQSLGRDWGLFDTLRLLIRQHENFPNFTENQNATSTLNSKSIYMHNAVLVLKDIHEHLKNDAITAQLKYLAQLIYKGDLEDCNIIIVSPIQVIPKEIENYMMILDFSHLSSDEIRTIVEEFCEGQETLKIKEKVKDSLVKELKGLTEFQIVNILALAYAGDGEINEEDLKWITEQKKQIIRKSGILEVIDANARLEDIGGLAGLTKWIQKKAEIFRHLDEAQKCGVDQPKGILIAGMPGCGKSLSAKVTAHSFGNFPLLRIDMGRVMGKYVGESEENMRQALRQADAIAPAILWIDELEKAFAGIGGDGGAAEVTTRLFGTFLTWMQEKKSPAFVVATANDISALPSELLRKGRFDEVFYIGLPNPEERKEIFKIHLRKRKHKDDLNDEQIESLAKKTEGFSGADIEGVVRESIERTFLEALQKGQYTNPSDVIITEETISDVIINTNSLKEMRPDAIEKIEKFYKKYKFKDASKDEEHEKGTGLFGLWKN